jgi:hypothetical protein
MEGGTGRRRGMTARRPRARRAERGMNLERLDRWFDTLDPRHASKACRFWMVT